MADENFARRRKSVNLSVSKDGGAPRKQTDEDVAAKKKRASSFRMSLSKAFPRPSMKRKPNPGIEFIPRDSETLQPRSTEPSWISVAWHFLTDDMLEPKKAIFEESYMYHLRSFAMYILHAVLVLWVVYGTFDLEYNYHSIIMADLITKSYFNSSFLSSINSDGTNFQQIRAPQQIWDFIRGVMLKILYPVETSNDTLSILQDNIMIGVAQLRQVRVKKDTCETVPFFRYLYKHCYGYFSDLDEDREPFGLNTSTAWVWWENPQGKTARGKFFDFSGNGYALNFSQDYAYTVNQLKELEDNTWIRLGTRAVMMDFATFCPNIHAFLVVKIVFEIMPWGAVYPSLKIYSLKQLTSLNDARAYMILGMDAILLGYTIGLNFMVFLRLKRTGMKKLFSFKNLIDIAIVLSTYTALGVHISLAYYINQRLDTIVEMVHKSENPSFGILILIYEHYLTVAAVLLFCIMLKCLRYAVYFNETAKLMICALRKVKGELICFTIMNFSILFGWSFAICVIYGSVYPQMKSVMKTMVILIFHHTRAYDFFLKDDDEEMVPPPMARLSTFVVPAALFYISCISLPTYVALMVRGWQLALRDCSKEALRIKAFEATLIRIVQILEKLRLYKYAHKLQEYYIIQMNEDDYFPMVHLMRRHGWTHREIRLLLRKYGVRKGDDLSIEELFEVYQDFWVRNTLFFEVSSHENIKNDLEYIRRMIKYTESTIADLKLSIERLADQVLDKQVKEQPIRREPSSPGSQASEPRKSLISRFSGIWSSGKR